MKWVRCPTCRTLNDVDRYPQCDGCQGDLTGLPAAPAPARVSASVAQQGERDSKSAHWIVWVLTGGLLVMTFILPAGGSIITAFLALLLIAALFIQLGVRRIRRTGLPFIVQGLLGLIAVGASLVGAVLLVALACSGPLQRVSL